MHELTIRRVQKPMITYLRLETFTLQHTQLYKLSTLNYLTVTSDFLKV